MRARFARAIGIAVGLALVGIPGASPAAAAATTTGLYLDGEPGEYVSLGNQLAFVEPAFALTPGQASPDHNFVSFGVDGETWGVAISAPVGQTLTAGTSFPAMTLGGAAGIGGLLVSGDGRACTLDDGEVTVLEVAFDHADVVSAFAADFWMDCQDGTTARLHGSVRYQSAFQLRAITVDPDVVDLGDTLVGTPSAARQVTIRNAGTSPVQFSDPRFEGPDAAAFEIVGTPCSVVLPGDDCTVDVRGISASRGAKHADLVVPDSTLRGERRMAISTDAYQPTTTALTVTSMDPDIGFGPEVKVVVSPNPGAPDYPGGRRRVDLSWTYGSTTGHALESLDPATGVLGPVALGIGPGTWTITATFPRQDYIEASSDVIADLFVPLATWTQLAVDTVPSPGGTAHLHATVHTIFSEPLEPGVLTIRAGDDVIASGPVGVGARTLDADACCLAAGDHQFTAAYEPDTTAALGSTTSLTITVSDPVPYGFLYLETATQWVNSPLLIAHGEASVEGGTVTRMRVSNDGVLWGERPYPGGFEWDVTDPEFGGSAADGRHIVYAQWATADGAWGAVATASVELDRNVPTSSVPATSVTASRSTTGSAAPVELRWAGSDDRSGIDHYIVARSIDGATYDPVAISLPSPSITQVLPTGHAYRFRIQPVDAAGNPGAWAYGSAFRLSGISQSSRAVRYAGSWWTSRSDRWWGGTARSSSAKGATAKYTFTGRSIAWVGLRAPSRGRAAVYVNGVYKTTVDLLAATTHKQVVVWSANWSTSATRTVTIKVLGTAGRPRVDLDGFIVRR